MKVSREANFIYVRSESPLPGMSSGKPRRGLYAAGFRTVPLEVQGVLGWGLVEYSKGESSGLVLSPVHFLPFWKS